jgi:hypothetical protein
MTKQTEARELLKKDFCMSPSACGIGTDCTPCYEKENKALRESIESLLQELDKFRWRDVKDELPPIGRHVSLSLKNEESAIDKFICVGWRMSGFANSVAYWSGIPGEYFQIDESWEIVRWMPLSNKDNES